MSGNSNPRTFTIDNNYYEHERISNCFGNAYKVCYNSVNKNLVVETRSICDTTVVVMEEKVPKN